MLRFLNLLALRLLYAFIYSVFGAFFLFAMIVAPALAVFVVALLAWKQFNPPRTLSTAHGTARWGGFLDLYSAGMFTHHGLILGKLSATERPTLKQVLVALFLWRLRDTKAAVELNRLRLGFAQETVVTFPDFDIPHLATFGASGSGKSTAFVVPNLFEDHHNAVVLDPKGELFQLTAEHRAKRFDHRVVRIDPYKIATGTHFAADGFNPLSLTDLKSVLAVDDARRLANALIVRNPNTSEPFFDNGAQTFVQSILLFLFAKARNKECTLNSLRDILCSPVALKQAVRVMQDAPEYQGMLARMAGQLRSFQGRTRSSTLAVVGTQLDFLDSLPVAETLAQTTFDPRELLDGNMTIYLCLPVDRIRELMGLQRIFITSLINMVFQAGESRSRRIRFYLDEAATLGEIEALYSAVVYGRSFGLRPFFLFQSTSQVELCFPKSKADDFRATVASLFCGTNDLRTAQEISQWIGQTSAASYSTQTSRNWGTSTNSGRDASHGTSQGYSTSETVNETTRSLIQAEEILQLSTAEAIVLLPHLRPFRVLKMPYYAVRRCLRTRLARIAEFAVLSFCALGLAIFAAIWIANPRIFMPQRVQQAVLSHEHQPLAPWSVPPEASDGLDAPQSTSH